MTAHILFFGATADIVGARTLDFSIAENLKATEFLSEVVKRFPALASHKLHLSHNQQYPAGDEVIQNGDELAIFTAVSGG